MLCAKFKMHNGRTKTKEEHIKKLAHSLAADSEQKKNLKKKDKKKGTRRKKDSAYDPSSGGMTPKSPGLRQILPAHTHKI